jgi:hypothetical protein
VKPAYLNSHEYARKLQALADFLLSRPEFDTQTDIIDGSFWYWSDKEKFLAAVRALTPGRKEYGEGTERDALYFYPSGVPQGTKLRLRVERALFCRKVQEEKWECEPLLSPGEERQLDGAGLRDNNGRSVENE